MMLGVKRFFVRILIQIVRVGAILVYYTKRIASAFKTPTKSIARYMLRTFGVPLYRGLFFVRRLIARVYIPGKHRLTFLFTNRYAVHVLVVIIATSTIGMSVQASSLRSEDFGKRSMLYGLVTGETDDVVFVGADIVTAKPSRYLGVSTLQPGGGLDFHDPLDDYVALSSGSVAVIAPTVAEAQASVAPRTGVSEYTVQPGDVLGTIAQSQGISLSTLLWANDLSVRSIVRPGDTLKILPVDGIQHTVKSGDNLSKLARSYDADMEDIVEYNELVGETLTVGTTLIIPGGTKPTVVAQPVRPSLPSITIRPTPQPVIAPPENTQTGTGRMVWPTDLQVITQYYGWRHTGVDIDCHFTHNNYAADDGYVQFSGWKGGYGLTVEINHGNGLVTRYGHGARNYISEGATVAKGDPIQLCGTTGRSTGTHLHFEVIANGQFRNPLEYIR